MNRLKASFQLMATLAVFYTSYTTYHYFFDKVAPEIELQGLETNGHYANTVDCCLKGSDKYKVSDLSVWLDSKPLINKFKVSARSFEHQFSIPTKNLPNGNHTLKVEVTNGTYSKLKTTLEKQFVVDNEPLHGVFLKSATEYKVFQGRTLHVQFQVNKKVKQARIVTLDNSFVCFPEAKNSSIYECFIPIACEENPNEYLLTAELQDLVGNALKIDTKFQVVAFPFKNHILKVDAEKIRQEKELGLSHEMLEQEIERLVQKSPQEKLWHGVFFPPIEIQRISTEYGTVRTTQEKGRYIHKAVDVLNTPKSVIWAPQDGIVVIKNRYEQSGNTVVLDHGYGIFSLFYHLDEFAEKLQVGQLVKRGNPLGTLGKTGYASGYHLHWEQRINNVPVDPLQWTSQQF